MSMEDVFQVDSQIVNQVYREYPNYLIEKSGNTKKCAIYFSSNDIYYPNTEEVFRKRIVEKNFFEWYKIRINDAGKHIFVRDVFKQWYLKGINRELDSIEKLATFLKKETAGYEVVTIGSSAGGYAALLFGHLLKAHTVMTFNSQFELKSRLISSNEFINPLLFRLKNTDAINYYDITNILNPSTSITNIFYFYSEKSQEDICQYRHIENNIARQFHIIKFRTSHHGIPFLKTALKSVINMSVTDLMKFEHKSHHPIIFTIQCVGFKATLYGLYHQLIDIYKRRR